MPRIGSVDEARKASAGSEPAPAGVYIMYVAKAWTKQSDNKYIMKWVVASGENAGKSAYERFDLDSDMGKGFLLRRMETLGVELQQSGSNQLSFDDSAPIGAIAEVRLVEKNGWVNVRGVTAVTADVEINVREALRAADPVGAAASSSTDDDDVPF
ncbi:MAG: hypothetical protein EPN91_02395 [Salinibacterium sp.]|nr:MAG: hypothetical protein EPN91_02395 [Salinibacterium sp.]